MTQTFEHGDVLRAMKTAEICFEERGEYTAIVEQGTIGIVDCNMIYSDGTRPSSHIIHVLGESWAAFREPTWFWEKVDDE